MDTYTKTKASNPTLNRLKNKHSVLVGEIKYLSDEIHYLKEIMRKKQRKLRVLNLDIIYKVAQQPALRVIQSPCSIAYLSGSLKSKPKVKLMCLKGGKLSSK